MKRIAILIVSIMFAVSCLYADISDRISSVEIAQGWDYGYPDADLVYELTFRVETDTEVNLIEFFTPAGQTFQIQPSAEQCIGEICTTYTSDGNTSHWEYYGGFADPASLSDYGDGVYTVTAYLASGGQVQTTASFTIPGTSDPIPQSTQEPVLTYPSHNSSVQSPFTFTWNDCNDSAANLIVLSLGKPDSDNSTFKSFTPDATRWDNLNVFESPWEADLSFGARYDWFLNSDDVKVRVSKYSESDASFTTTSNNHSYPFWPMQVGQVWTYQVTDSLGNSWIRTWEVDSITSINGKEYFQIISTNFDNEGEIDVVTVRSTENAIYSWGEDVENVETMEFVLSSLGTITRSFDGEEWDYRVLDRYEIVSLGLLGTFEAIVYHAFPSYDDGTNGYPEIDRNLYWEEYLVPGFGIVKMVDTNFEGIGEPIPAYAPAVHILVDVSPSADFCGMIGRPYPEGDLNEDCVVNMLDLAKLAANWLQNTMQ